MNIEEAIKTALNYETKVKKLYSEALEKTKSEVGMRIFSVMEKEEQYHIDYLNERYNEWKESGTINREELRSSLPSAEKIKEGLKNAKNKVKESISEDELQILQKLLAAETETSGFYTKLLNELSEDDRVLFEPFVEIEKGHVALVQAEIDSVQGLGFWFDMQEFDLEAG